MRSRYLMDTPIMGGSPRKKKRPNNPTKYQGFPFYKLDGSGKHFHLSGDNINYYITMSLFEYLKRLDEFFFILIHNDSDHRMLDGWMVALLNPLASLPVYLFIFYKAARKTAHIPWLFIVFNAITVVITAGTAELFIKPKFARLSPCLDPEVQRFVRGILSCSAHYSFPAPVAAVYCGLTVFWLGAVSKTKEKGWRWIWIWPGLVGYAAIYAGQNFPSDIIAGAILGMLTGWAMAIFFRFFGYPKGRSPQMGYYFGKKGSPQSATH